MTAYYNEIDKYAAQWLRNLIAAGHIPDGEVDNRDIRDVVPSDLKKFDQCHFFAGIGVWAYALRSAGVPDDRKIWTASCPCQPFSAAGGRAGFADERHLWPSFYHLLREFNPGVVLGEQVASKDGLAWLDLVQADMEAADYAFAPVDICGAGVGAPHIRQRLYFVGLADSEYKGFQGRVSGRENSQWEALYGHPGRGSPTLGVVDTACPLGSGGRVQRPGESDSPLSGQAPEQRPERGSASGGVADVDLARRSEQPERDLTDAQSRANADGCSGSGEGGRGPTNGFWGAADWLRCQDAKWRPTEPSIQPLAHGATARVGRLRAYGNAIIAPLAKEFVGAALL